jgi:hypothetical protein
VPILPVVCSFYLFKLAYLAKDLKTIAPNHLFLTFRLVCSCLLANIFQDKRQFLLTLIQRYKHFLTFSRLILQITLVCSLYLYLLAYLPMNFRTFPDVIAKWLRFVVFICSYLLTWPKNARLELQITVVCSFHLSILTSKISRHMIQFTVVWSFYFKIASSLYFSDCM